MLVRNSRLFAGLEATSLGTMSCEPGEAVAFLSRQPRSASSSFDSGSDEGGANVVISDDTTPLPVVIVESGAGRRVGRETGGEENDVVVVETDDDCRPVDSAAGSTLEST
jgi:hypothetical protein